MSEFSIKLADWKYLDKVIRLGLDLIGDGLVPDCVTGIGGIQTQHTALWVKETVIGRSAASSQMLLVYGHLSFSFLFSLLWASGFHRDLFLLLLDCLTQWMPTFSLCLLPRIHHLFLSICLFALLPVSKYRCFFKSLPFVASVPLIWEILLYCWIKILRCLVRSFFGMKVLVRPCTSRSVTSALVAAL